MRLLIALASGEPADIDRAVEGVQELSRSGHLQVVDLAVLSGDQRIHHYAGRAAHMDVAPTALLGALLGGGLGLLVARPVIGAVLGVAIAGAAKLVTPHRISDRFIKSLSNSIADDETALFILADGIDDPELLRRATGQTDKLLYASDAQARELLNPT